MRSIVLVLACFIGFQVSLGDIYWRDYNGTVPHDAIPGGKIDNTTTYIGLISALEFGSPDVPDVVSATIFSQNITGFAAYHEGVFVNDRGVKILCSPDQERLKWVAKVPSDCSLVRGSYGANYTTYYIGRGIYKKQVCTGRFGGKSLFIPWLGPPNIRVELKKFDKLVSC